MVSVFLKTLANIFYVISSITSSTIILSEKTSDNYGPYSIQWTEYKSCAKPTNQVRLLTKMCTPLPDGSRAPNLEPIFHFNLTIVTPVTVDLMKLDFYTIKNGSRKMFVSKRLVKPCHSYYLTLFTALNIIKFKSNTKDCVLAKGIYVFDLNFTDLSRLLLGDRFFYGEYYVHAVVLSKSKVITCVIISSLFKKFSS